MTHMTAHALTDIDETGADTGFHLAWVQPASEESVQTVLNADEHSSDGRSNWVWVRLRNGDLILGVFPQGDTYFATERDHSTPPQEPGHAGCDPLEKGLLAAARAERDEMDRDTAAIAALEKDRKDTP